MTSPCSINDCPKKVVARGWCSMHYWRWQNYGDASIEPPSRKRAETPCSAEDCAAIAKTAGYCIAHYKRKLRHGDPASGGSVRDRRPLPERFASAYVVASTGCWEWQRELDVGGYGVMRAGGRVSAHRYSFTQANGREPSSDLDHACRNRRRVNPAHLREVEAFQNQQNLATLRNTRSGYRGVAWHEFSQSWHVVVKFRGHQHSGGYFKDVHEAGRAAMELRNHLYTHNEEDRMLTA